MNFLKTYQIQKNPFFMYLFSLLVFFTSNIFIYSQELQPIPELKERVTDLSGILSTEEKLELSEKLKAHETQTTNQIVILIIPTTAPETIEQYSLRVVEKWKLGQKEKNNGVLLLFVMQDRKIRIEVGYGLEGVLPDAKVSRIIREVIVPKFKERKFYEGIDTGVNAILDVLTKGEFEAPSQIRQEKKTSLEDNEVEKAFSFIISFFIGTYILFNFIASFFSIQNFFLSLLLFGSMSFLGSFVLKSLEIAIAITFINLVIFFLFEFFKRFSDSSGTYYSSSGSGSSSFDFSSSSSSSSFDSFSGGGGSFGGGGASGSWD